MSVSPVLRVPEREHDVWAEADIMRIARALREGRQESTFEIAEEAMRPPFSVIVAATNDQTNTKIIVMGMGLSLTDSYLQQRVMRFEGKRSRLVTDPPPTENVDLVFNSLYWLAGREDLIAAGPAPVPRVGPIEETTQRNLWIAVFAWAFVILIAGGVVMMVRRK